MQSSTLCQEDIVDSQEDDTIVAEVDLYITRLPEDQDLHVLQYPLRHSKVGVGTERRVTGVNIRPNYGRLEIKLAVLPDDPATITDDLDCIQQSSQSFDTAQQTAGEKPIGRIQTLRSRMNLSPADCNYAVSTLLHPSDQHESECGPKVTAKQKPVFVIIPVHATSQLRPAFDYIDDLDLAQLQQRLRETQLRSNPRDGESGGDDGLSQLQLSFRRRETERAAERRRTSHATLREKEEGEAWIELEYAPTRTSDAKRRVGQLFDPTSLPTVHIKKDENPGAKIDYKDLFAEHTKGARLDLAAKGTMGAESSSARALKQLATKSAVAQVVSYARIISFGDIVEVIGDRPEKDVILATRSVALCLRGCWVSRSGAKDMRRQMSASERYEACRVLVLNLFRKSRVTSTKDAENEIGDDMVISDQTLKSILEEVAVLQRGYGWVLKVEDDVDFMKRYPGVCRAQDAEWDKRVISSRETVDKALRQIRRRSHL